MDIVIRVVVVFVFLVALMRVIGRRELGDMEPFDLILLVVTGDLTQQAITQDDTSLTGMAIAISTLAVLTVGASYATFKIRRLRPLMQGQPIVLVADGEIVRPNLRRERITVEELAAEARLQQIAHLDEIRWAVLETSGKISFIPR